MRNYSTLEWAEAQKANILERGGGGVGGRPTYITEYHPRRIDFPISAALMIIYEYSE